MLDVGQANEIKLAFRREGPWTNEKIKMLTEQKGLLRKIHEVLLGHAEIKPIDYIIDLDSDPFVPEGWSVVEHHKGGQFKFEPKKVRMHLFDEQKTRDGMSVDKLRREIVKFSPFNANMLDSLLQEKNQHLIPREWNNTAFWGTIYHQEYHEKRYNNSGLCVRCLQIGPGDLENVLTWGWMFYDIDKNSTNFGDHETTAVPVN